MDKRPLLSIIVPTKDRYYYLKHLIKLIDSFHFGPDVELVIQDNTADNKEIVDFLNANKFDFIVYDHHTEQLPISLNSDKAVKNSSGEYICFIGDDDGITRYILGGVRWMKEKGIDVVKPAEVYYLWPDAIGAVNVTESALLHYRKFTGQVKYASSFEELMKGLKHGFPDRGNMPLVYHGIASRTILEKIYDKCGTYFPGNSPDIASAVALSLCTQKFALVNLPWVIYGSCVSKGGGERMPGRNFPPKISDIPHWVPNAEQRWYNKIPKVAIWVTIWPESAICALQNMGRKDLLDKFNKNEHYARFLVHYPNLHSYVDELNINASQVKIEYYKLIAQKYVNALFRRIGWLMGINRVHWIKGIDTINDAASSLEAVCNGEINDK